MMTATECRKMRMFGAEGVQDVRDMFPALSEVFWFVLSLVLFIVLGPFSAPIALIAVFTIDREHRGLSEPEAADTGI